MKARKFYFMLLIVFFISLISVLPSFAEQFSKTSAPVSKEFTEWKNNGRKGVTPSVRDFSHLQFNRPENNAKVKAVSLPSYFDLRNENRLPPVRDSGIFGTCSMFAALGAMESSYLTQNFKSLGTNPNLSELHMAWFLYKDPIISNNFTYDSSYSILNQGGNPYKTSAYILRQSGPVNESSMPYSIAGSDKYTADSNISSYVGSKKPSDFFPLSLELVERYDLGEITSSNRNIIKQMIMEYGAVYVSYYLDYDFNFSDVGTTYFSNYYGTSINHSVLLVGWDDNYSRYNFGSNMPSTNGAWIVLNSRGSDWGDDGYFYMSYEQYTNQATVFIAGETTDEKVYYYDALGDTNAFRYNANPLTGYAANVFKAESKEKITSIGFFTTDNNTKYEIYIFTNQGTTHPSAPNITSAKPTLSGTQPYAGYHTCKLSKPLTVKKGNYFTVVVKTINPSYEYPMAMEFPMSGYAENVAAETGESYFSVYGTDWEDGATMDPIRSACIKAFTTSATASAPLSISSTIKDSGTVGTSYSGTATVSGGVSPYTWKQSGTLPTNLKFTSSGATATVKGKPTEAGKFTFTLKAADSNGDSVSKKFTVTISAAPEPDDDLEIETDFNETGKVDEYYEGKATVSGGTAPYEWDYNGDLPTGLELKANSNGTKATISGKALEAGEFSFTLQVKDKNGITEEEVVIITIEEPDPDPLEIDEFDFDESWYLKKSYTGTATAKGGVAPYTWEVDGDLPPGLQLSDPEDDDWTEAEISGKPVTAGTYGFTLIVTDSNGDSSERDVKITITAPKISGSFKNTWLLKKSYSSYITIKGTEGAYKASKSSGTLPNGLKLSVSGSKVYLKGTPSKADKFTFKIKVKDGNGATVSKSYTITITAPEITGTFKAGTVGKTYSGTATVTGGVATYIWKASGVPDGLEFTQNAKGTKAYLKGKPTKAKTYTLKLTVTDKNGAKATKSFKVQIKKKSTKTLESSQKVTTTPLTFNFGDGQNIATELTLLEVFSDDILSKGEGRDEDLITVKADNLVRFRIGEWPVEISRNEIQILIDDEVKNEIEISDENSFTIPKEFVKGDFKVKAEAGEFETIELFITAE